MKPRSAYIVHTRQLHDTPVLEKRCEIFASLVSSPLFPAPLDPFFGTPVPNLRADWMGAMPNDSFFLKSISVCTSLPRPRLPSGRFESLREVEGAGDKKLPVRNIVMPR